MELVDDEDVEVTLVERIETGCGQALDRREHAVEPGRAMVADPELAKAGVADGVAEGGPGLLQDLLAVGNEQEPRSWHGRTQSGVVDGRHHRLAGTGRGNEQVS